MKTQLLLVDDEQNLQALMAEFFSSNRYEVQCASEAEEAIAMIRHHHFDLVISDLELNSVEGLNGFSVLKTLRQFAPNAKIIVYSGHTDAQVMEAALRHGGNKFLAKPLALTELLANAEELCPPS
jgi:CheY-like chemotaxis protein